MLVEIEKKYRQHGDAHEILSIVASDFGTNGDVTKEPFYGGDFFPWTQFAYAFQSGENFVGWNHDSSETHIYIRSDVNVFEEYVVLYSETPSSEVNARINEATEYTHKQLPFYEWRIKSSVDSNYVITEVWEHRNL